MPVPDRPGAVLPPAFDDLRLTRITVGEVSLRVRTGGSGPPLLLLHGYPETHLAWAGSPTAWRSTRRRWCGG
jgi:haloacetate dehalogenase